MNKYILSIKLILILCLSLQAQTSDIQIKVLTEAENEPLFGATVYFEALEKGAVTNFDGNPRIFFTDFDARRRLLSLNKKHQALGRWDL